MWPFTKKIEAVRYWEKRAKNILSDASEIIASELQGRLADATKSSINKDNFLLHFRASHLQLVRMMTSRNCSDPIKFCGVHGNKQSKVSV